MKRISRLLIIIIMIIIMGCISISVNATEGEDNHALYELLDECAK